MIWVLRLSHSSAAHAGITGTEQGVAGVRRQQGWTALTTAAAVVVITGISRGTTGPAAGEVEVEVDGT